MSLVRFHLSIPADDYLAYYQGAARAVSVVAADGRRIEFPAAVLRPFVGHEGIYGWFEIEFDQNRRLVDIRRLQR
ncbi:MAG TPA: DUF2835 family protein [Gammaproteobacteria bacterium]|nr:DUF2835 family protein [Gammaproteobacteria bacterium]